MLALHERDRRGTPEGDTAAVSVVRISDLPSRSTGATGQKVIPRAAKAFRTRFAAVAPSRASALL